MLVVSIDPVSSSIEINTTQLFVIAAILSITCDKRQDFT